jgi:D-glycero-alpha-D-manno-heptose 1-phosphate guanylyltransferase
MSTTLDIPAALLVGGMGTRLRSVVPTKPKPLASVGSRSFLDLLIRQLRNQEIRRLVMCTGYLADQIEKEFGDGHSWDVMIQYSKEPKPLGTAGAVKLAQQYLSSAPYFFVLNGDSFLQIDFLRLMRFHQGHGGVASIAVFRVDNASQYGTVQVDSGGRVTGFSEKTGSQAPGLVNAGVYVFKRTVFELIPEGPASLERNVFPQLLDYGVSALEHDGLFIDIGTPEDYARAQQLCRRLYEAASYSRPL